MWYWKKYLTFFILVLIVFSPLPLLSQNIDAVSPDGWEVYNPPIPQGIGLRGIWGSSSSDVFTVGGGGTILHYNGSNWAL